MNRAAKLLVLLGWLTMARGAMAQSQPHRQDSEFITTYVVERVAGGGQPHQIIGVYSARDEANLCHLEWTDSHPNDLRFSRVREVSIRIPRSRPAAPRPTPLPALKPATGHGETMPNSDYLPGTTWVGSETLQGFGRLEFHFVDYRRVKMIDAQAEVMGSWQRDGDSVRLTFYDGRCIYVGTMNGSYISGRATTGKTSFTWSVSR